MNTNATVKKQSGDYKFLLLLCMIYCSILLLSGIYVYRPVIINAHYFAASSLIYPLSYTFNDIICEVYGYQYSRRLIWFGMFSIFFFAFISKVLNNLPFPPNWHNQKAYAIILDPYLRLSFAGLGSMLVGEFFNTIALSKWKVLLRGRMFWLRSLGSTSIGSFFDTGAEYIFAFLGVVSSRQMGEMFLIAYMFRILYSLIAVIPSTLIVKILKTVENTQEFKPVITYNPFSLSEA